MRHAVHAEFTKLRTTAGPAWLLLTCVAVTVALGAAVTATMSCPGNGCGLDAVRLSLASVPSARRRWRSWPSSSSAASTAAA